ncbi:MAG: heavy-metal-associated domain-containing protein [Prolixibacteraceae bacterium]
MKTKVIGLMTVFMLAAFFVFAQNTTEEIKVKGNNNEMSKERIEKAAKSVEGVKEAEWNAETMMLAVDFDESQTSLDEIEKAIAKTGHDTPNQKAEDEVYNKLPEECKYRDKVEKKKE